MDVKRPILGLIATNIAPDEESDFFFDNESDDDNFEPLKIAPPSVPPPTIGLIKPPPPPPPPSSEKQEDRIKSFDDAYPKITAILASLDDYDFKKASVPFTGDISFIPEHIVSDEKSAEFNTYAHSTDPKARFFPPGDAHEIVLAQIEIVNYYKNQKVDFTKFKLKSLDSRISSLIYYILSKTDDHHVSCYYCFMCLTDFLKSPTVAPVASLFPDFELKLIVHKLCSDLVSLFPHHPLLPSVIHKFNNVDPTVLSLLDEIGSEDSDSDESFSDSFFDSIANVQQARPPVIVLPGQFSSTLTNVLENCQITANDQIQIAVNEPPSTFTFHLPGCSQFTPNSFVDWIVSIYPKKDDSNGQNNSSNIDQDDDLDLTQFKTHAPSGMHNKKKKSRKGSFSNRKSSPLIQIEDESLKEEEKKKVDSSTLINLLNINILDAQKEMPNIEDREDLFHIQYPMLQMILINNLTSILPTSSILKKCPFPEILDIENKTNSLFVSDCNQESSQQPKSQSSNIINELYEKIFEIVPEKEILSKKDTQIQRLPKLREMPKLDEQECTSDEMKLLIYLSDIEFLLNGRSPLNLSRNGIQTTLSSKIRPNERASILYHYYSTKVYPPFITFRTAFALALNLFDYKPQYATDLLFEGIYAVLNCIPSMAKLESVRSGMLFFADLLEKMDRYYYSCLFFDAFYLYSQNGSKLDLTSLTNIASLCQKNHDAARTAFYYSKSLERYVSNRQIEEALYITQMLANTYNDYGLQSCSVNLLCHILKDSYKLKIAVNLSRSQLAKIGRKTIQPVRKKSNIAEFKPPPDSINTLLTGISLCEVLLNCHYFTLANELLEEMKNSTDNQMFIRIIEYLKVRNLIKQNNYEEFLANLSNLQIQLKAKRGAIGSRLSLHNASNFDPSLAVVKLLMRGSVTRSLFKEAIFWSEVYIMAQTNQSLKDIGLGLLHRGIALRKAASEMHITNPPYSLHVEKMTDLMNDLAFYSKSRNYKSIGEIISEAASSFKAAWICFDRVGSSRLATKATLFYVDIILHYFVDSLFDKVTSQTKDPSDNKNDKHDDEIRIGKGDDDEDESSDGYQDEWLPGPEKIVIDEPQFDLQVKGIPVNKIVSFQSVTLDISSCIDDTSALFRRIDQNVNRDMDPVNIIYSQILKAKLNFLQHKESTARTLFDYAYANINKYFVCGGDFIPKRMKLKTLHVFQNILDNMVCFLFFNDSSFINDRLVIIDWRNDMQSIIQNRLRVVTEENQTPIQSNIEISWQMLKDMSSQKFPDIEQTFELANNSSKPLGSSNASNGNELTENISLSTSMENMKNEESQQKLSNISRVQTTPLLRSNTNSQSEKEQLSSSSTEQEKDSIERYLAKINTNIRLFESQKVKEDEMHACNRKLCRQIEIFADQYRRENESKRPIDTSYNFVFKTRPNLHCAVFVEHIFESIFIYIPSNKLIRRVPLSPAKEPSSFTVCSNKGNFTYKSMSGLFNSKFFSIISLFLMCDKKQHHTEYNSQTAMKVFQEAKEALFGDICDKVLLPWDKELDNHLFGENKLFGKGLKGALSSIITSTQPAIFFTCGNLRAIPFEMMFPNVLILRSWSYCHAILKPVELSSYPCPTVCRWKGTAEHLMQNAVKRSEEVIRSFLNGCGGWYPMTPYVKGNERNVCFPFPLFSSNKENSHYASQYHFCKFIDVEPNKFPKIDSALFIFTYSDMCEMPLMLKSLVTQFPFSFYMFIPAQFVREAFKLMIAIFERHKRREEYFRKNADNIEEMASKHSIILQVPYDFVTCLQDTLKEQLKCPVSLIVPTH